MPQSTFASRQYIIPHFCICAVIIFQAHSAHQWCSGQCAIYSLCHELGYDMFTEAWQEVRCDDVLMGSSPKVDTQIHSFTTSMVNYFNYATFLQFKICEQKLCRKEAKLQKLCKQFLLQKSIQFAGVAISTFSHSKLNGLRE